MLLLDSNILIYASQPQHAALRRILAREALSVSVISKIEVLGFSRLDPGDARFFRALFDRLWVIALEPPIVDSAIDLRQRRRMSLGDSIVAATALVHQLQLVTHNSDDFRWIDDLRWHDPLRGETNP